MLSLIIVLPCAVAQATDDTAIISSILDEGLNHSEVAHIAAHLTDQIGGRLTNSPQMREAEAWAQAWFQTIGLKSVRAEGFNFGRGWSIDSSSVRMIAPRSWPLRAIPVAWTPATNGTVTAPVILAPLTRENDFAKWRGLLRGKVVMVSKPGDPIEVIDAPFKRLSDEELSRLEGYVPRVHSALERERLQRRGAFAAKRDDFLASEDALAWISKAYGDGGVLHGEGYGFRIGETPKIPGIEVAAEDYRLLARLAIRGGAPQVAIDSNVRFHDEDLHAYNILGEIPGRDAKAGYVMAGAHLDSWIAAAGAVDNAAGCAVVMEAARILTRVGVKARRAIRFVLWTGADQGYLGSIDYVERHLARRPPVTDPDKARLLPEFTWFHQWPVDALAGHSDLAAYFNVDNGSGKVRGIHTEGNVAVIPIFEEWLAPFASMGAATVAASPTGGTDHVPMQSVGIPGFQFIQDPLDYDAIAHTSMDTFDRLNLSDLRQAAIVLAAMLLKAAEREGPLPRMPLPRAPRETDPFVYQNEVEEK
jgi:hypothetical protein